MNDAVLNAVQVSPSEKISFRCTGCSACCRHVRQSVVLESLDVFRITKYLRDRDSNIKSTDDFLEKHAEIALLDECGFFVFMLKVQDADDACRFPQGEPLHDSFGKTQSVPDISLYRKSNGKRPLRILSEQRANTSLQRT